MKSSIKLITERIKKLNEHIIVLELLSEDPEVSGDLDFTSSEIANAELKIIELQTDLQILVNAIN